MSNLERYFRAYRKNIVGVNESFKSPNGKKKLLYADWVASGRLYKPIEVKLMTSVGPFVANPHTESNITGSTITQAYIYAQQQIKKHVNASMEKDALITSGAGMTDTVNKLQRLLGLRLPEKFQKRLYLKNENRPVVFVTHMEHHSNHTSWLETIADVVVVEPDQNNLISLTNLRRTVERYKNRKLKIGAFTACSNVTGIETPYHQMASIMHENGGLCFVDFACSAPYVKINMRPGNRLEHLDAIFFSPHKFLGGPGTSGVVIFKKDLYKNHVPDHPGGGTVQWTNPWGEKSYYTDVERREDGGTPDYLQVIKTAFCIKLKEEMGAENIRKREKEQLEIVFSKLTTIKGLHILQNDVRKRLGVISFYCENLHYNLLTKLLCDRYGIQVRGGCACAGTYGHYLLNIDQGLSKQITDKIEQGDLSTKPGWVRLSLHPTMTNREILYILNSIKEVVDKGHIWKSDYTYNSLKNEFFHKKCVKQVNIKSWFETR